jgi:hypothetical protein
MRLSVSTGIGAVVALLLMAQAGVANAAPVVGAANDSVGEYDVYDDDIWRVEAAHDQDKGQVAVLLRYVEPVSEYSDPSFDIYFETRASGCEQSEYGAGGTRGSLNAYAFEGGTPDRFFYTVGENYDSREATYTVAADRQSVSFIVTDEALKAHRYLCVIGATGESFSPDDRFQGFYLGVVEPAGGWPERSLHEFPACADIDPIRSPEIELVAPARIAAGRVAVAQFEDAQDVWEQPEARVTIKRGSASPRKLNRASTYRWAYRARPGQKVLLQSTYTDDLNLGKRSTECRRYGAVTTRGIRGELPRIRIDRLRDARWRRDDYAYGGRSILRVRMNSRDCQTVARHGKVTLRVTGAGRQRLIQMRDICGSWATKQARSVTGNLVGARAHEGRVLAYYRVRVRRSNYMQSYRYQLRIGRTAVVRGSFVFQSKFRPGYRVWEGSDKYWNYCINEPEVRIWSKGGRLYCWYPHSHRYGIKRLRR